MNTEQLESLVIDEHFGELAPEVSALLRAYIDLHPQARTAAEDILSALSITQRTLQQHPELARVPISAPPVKTMPIFANKKWRPLAAAAALLFLGTLGALFFTAPTPETQSVVAEQSATAVKKSPWTRYRMVIHPTGEGMQVVRVDEPKAAQEVYQ
jgi:hypothetical protein